MATIKDVASMAGVSIATVSNYLNQTKPVSKKASAKIQKAVDTLQYTQNLSAKSLKSNAYTDIGIILPNFDDSYYVQLFQGIESTFQNTSYYANLAFSYDIPDFEQTIVHNFLKKQICGLILVSCQPDNWKFYYEHFTSDGRPLVLLDRDIRNLDANFVSFDNYSMIQRITKQLLIQNYKKIFLVSGPEAFECEANCIHGFFDSLESNGSFPDPSFLIQTNLSKEDSFRKTIQLLHSKTPEAMIATSESLAAGIIEALTILGYGSEDIPVLTLGEEHWNLYTHSFASSSMVRPAIKLGKTAATLLLEQLSSPHTKENERIILKDISVTNHSSLRQPLPEPKAVHRIAPKKSLRILMLDTPQVHTLLGLLQNFENQRQTAVDVTILPHHHLYKAIQQAHQGHSSEPFDVVMYDIPWLSALASSHVLEDITPLLKNMNLNIFFPDCLKYFSTFNHRYYGLPFMYAPQIFYYRKDLFENPDLKANYERKNNITLRPPLTLKEFNTIADYFTNHTDIIDYGISIPAAYEECLAPELYMRLRAFGGSLFDNHGNVSLDQDASLKAYLNLLRSFRLAKPDYRTATDVSVVQDFLKGDTAMLITYPSFLTDVVDLRKSSMIGSIGYHHIPGRSPLLGGWSLGISSRSSQKQEAFSFLQWICDEQIANYFALLGGQSAITSTYTNDELIKLYPWLPLYHSTYQYTKPTIPPELGNHSVISQNDIDAIVCRWVYKLLDEKIEVQDAIANTHAELEALIEQYR